MQFLRVLGRRLLVLAAIAVLVPCLILGWLHFYTGGLPDTMQLMPFAPPAAGSVTIADCDKPSPATAIPYAQIGDHLRNAVLADQGEIDPRSWVSRIYQELTTDSPRSRYGNYSWQIARQFACACGDTRMGRQLATLRTAIQIERRFTDEEILNIYLNRVYLGNNIYGVENAASYYFGKHSAELTTEEAALIAGLARAPSRFSPAKHADRALARRNEVIDEMLRKGSLVADEAERAKRLPIKLVRRG
jgi:penicillin-binding protein 1A